MPHSPLSAKVLKALQGQDVTFPLPTVISSSKTLALCDDLQCSVLELAQLLLPYAASLNVTPHSHFPVGAIAIDDKQQLFFGANFESSLGSLTATVHAEQSAIINALHHQCGSIQQLVIDTAPCGFCRQFLQELDQAARLEIFFNQQQWTLDKLLPEAFSPLDLGLKQGLKPFPLSENIIPQQYAELSYSPYSGVKAAVFAYSGKELCAWSCYIENAAYNPSVSPLLGLLAQCALQQSTAKLSRISLWEKETNQFSFSKELELYAKQYPGLDLEFNYYT